MNTRSLLSYLLLAGSVAAVARADDEDSYLPDQALVRVASYATVDDFLALFNANWPGTSVARSIESRKIYQLDLPPGAFEPAVAADLMNFVNPNLAIVDPSRPLIWGELNYANAASEGQTGSIYVRHNPPPSSPIQFENQYFTTLLGLSAAQQSSRGAGVMVAVLDTGIDANHDVLLGRVLPNGYNFVTNSTATGDVGDQLDNDGDQLVDEMTGHGTFVAGLIALIAPDATLLPVVVLDSEGNGDAFQIAQGMFYALDAGADVLNMSLGSTYKSEAITDAISESAALGAVIVAAAGNLNRDEPEEYPAMASDVIGVASLDPNGVKAPFSNFEDKLVISAPGTSDTVPEVDPNWAIYGPIPGGDEDQYAVWEGTSFSTAMVSGTAALIRGQHPEWTYTQQSLRDRIRDNFKSTAMDIRDQNPQFDDELGEGMLDIAAAVAAGPASPITGDLNNDNVVDLTDLTTLLGAYGSVHSSADLDGDGPVDLNDLALLLSHYGEQR